jgi:hypothetical protein
MSNHKKKYITKDYIGQKFGRWLIVREAGAQITSKVAMVECLCDCGMTKIVALPTVITGKSKSCGCLRREIHTGEAHILTFQMVKETFEKNGYQLLSQEEETSGRALSSFTYRFLCPVHGEQAMTGASARRGSRCRKCADLETSSFQYSDFDDVAASFASEGVELLTTREEYKGSKSQLRYICPIHGEKQTKWDAWRVGKRCKVCSQLATESKLAVKLKQYCKDRYPDAIFEYAPILNPSTNMPLYFDIYIPSRGIYCEIMGQQHYQFVPWFHKDYAAFEGQMLRDDIKESYAWQHGRYVFIDLRKENSLDRAIQLLENGRGRVSNFAGELKFNYTQENQPWVDR